MDTGGRCCPIKSPAKGARLIGGKQIRSVASGHTVLESLTANPMIAGVISTTDIYAEYMGMH